MLLASCNSPAPAAAVTDSPLALGVRVVVDPALRESSAYLLGTNSNRYNPTARFIVQVSQLGAQVVVDCTSGGRLSRSTARIALDPNSHTAHAEVTWETDAVREQHWSNVYGLVVIDHWPSTSSDPFRLRYLLCGLEGNGGQGWSEAIDTNRTAKIEPPAPAAK